MRRETKVSLVVVAALAVCFGAGGVASATELDCATASSTCRTTGISFAGAFWSGTAEGSATSSAGTLNTFLVIKKNGAEDGVNTSGTFNNDEKTGTKAIQLSAVPIIRFNNTYYYEFFLDISEQSGETTLSLNNVKICLGSTGTLTATDTCPTTAGTPTRYNTAQYTMGTFGGGTGTDYVKLDDSVGSGQLFMYIPVTTLGTNMADYVYLFTQFGAAGGFIASNADEVWALRTCGELYGGVKLICDAPNTPEPGSLVLLGTGLAGLAAIAARRRRRQAVGS